MTSPKIDLERSRPLDEAVAASLEAAPAGHRLGRDQLRFVRTVALSVGIQGPVAGVLVGPAVLAGLVGGAGALSYGLGLVAMAFVAYAFVVFSRSFNSAGSVFAFNGAALGPTYGFASAWILLLVYVAFAGGVYASTADLAQTFLAGFAIHVSWVWPALAGAALAVALAYLSIGFSSLVIFACEGVAVVLLAVVGAVVVAKGGFHHHGMTAAPFLPHGIALGVLGLGVVNAFSAFSGFEGAATLGEETRRGTRTIPAAVAGSLVGAAAIYIVFTWIADNAFPSAAALAASPAPFVHLASVDVGAAMGHLVNLAGVVSAFGAQLACLNAANRLVFALSREVGDGAGRTALTRVSARFGSPVGALALTGATSVAALLAFSAEPSAVRALTIILEFGAYLMIVAYLLTVVAAAVWVWRHGRRRVPLTVLIVGTAVLAYVLYDTFVPFPPAPFGAVVLAAAAAALLGVGIALHPRIRPRLVGSRLLQAVRWAPTSPAPAPATVEA